MRSVVIVLCLALTAAVEAAAQPAQRPRDLRVTGASAVDALCTNLLDTLRRAEAEGRLDFTAEVESSGSDDVTARV